MKEGILQYLPCVSGVSGALGTIAGTIAAAFGGFDRGLQALLAIMAADYLTGMILAGVFHKSRKSESGALESKAGFKGLLRKGMILLMVLVAARLDALIGGHIVRDGVVAAYLINETVSVIENVGLMGVPIPSVLRKAIDVLSQRPGEKKM